MFKYGIILYWSNADDAFVAEVPELPGCTAHGDHTQEETRSRTSTGEAMELWIDTAKESGDPMTGTQGRASDAGVKQVRRNASTAGSFFG